MSPEGGRSLMYSENSKGAVWPDKGQEQGQIMRSQTTFLSHSENGRFDVMRNQRMILCLSPCVFLELSEGCMGGDIDTDGEADSL